MIIWTVSQARLFFDQKLSILGGWGKQSQYHILSFQGCDKKQVVILGKLRFNIIINFETKVSNHLLLEGYVLFVRTALSFDETVVLYRLEKIRSKNLNLFGSLKIIYRPHPHRQGNDTIVGDSLKNV